MWKETSVSNVMYNSWICPEGLRKIKTPSQDNFQVQVRAGNFQSVWGTSNPKAFAFDIQRVGSASAIQLHRMYNIFPPPPRARSGRYLFHTVRRQICVIRKGPHNIFKIPSSRRWKLQHLPKRRLPSPESRSDVAVKISTWANVPGTFFIRSLRQSTKILRNRVSLVKKWTPED